MLVEPGGTPPPRRPGLAKLTAERHHRRVVLPDHRVPAVARQWSMRPWRVSLAVTPAAFPLPLPYQRCPDASTGSARQAALPRLPSNSVSRIVNSCLGAMMRVVPQAGHVVATGGRQVDVGGSPG